MILTYAQDIYDWLKKNERPVVPLLQEGLSMEKINDLNKSLPVKMPHELKILYTWHNGTSKSGGYILGDVDFFPGFHFLPLEDAIAHYQTFIKDIRWEQEWFPFFANGGGDFYVSQCQKHELEKAPVVGFMIGTDYSEVEYHSLEQMLQTFSECYKRNVFFVGEDGYIDSNPYKEAVISNVINPGLSRWMDELT